MAIEVKIKRPGAPARLLRFSQTPVRIGRNQLNDIPLDDPFVSEWHGVIRYDDRQIAYFDLGSTNGTLLDGKRLVKNSPGVLTESSRLQLGMLEITAIQCAEEVNAAAPKRPQTGPTKTIGWGILTPAAGATGQAAPQGRPAEPVSRPSTAPNQHLAHSGWPMPPAVLPEASTPVAPSQSLPTSPVRDDSREPRGDSAAQLARQMKLIEAFSEAFIGLRKGYEQFGSEVGVRTVSGSTVLHRARTGEELVRHLMRPNVDASVVARDLIAVFADLGIHHIALMEGITEGVRALLQSLNPRMTERDGGGRLWSAAKSKTLWKTYLARFDRLLTDEEELHGSIFSDAFARAYASVTMGDGRNDNTDGDS